MAVIPSVPAAAAPIAPVQPQQTPTGGRLKWLRLAAAIVLAVVLVFPLYWMVVVAFSPRDELLTTQLRLWPGHFTLEHFDRVFSSFPVATWFGNSLAVTVVVTLITVVVNLMAGYAFAHLRFPGNSLVFLLFLSTLMLPVQVIMVSQFQLITDLNIYGTYWGVILPTAASAFGVFLARQFILGIPREVIEAARVDGAGSWRVFSRIILPLCKPLIAVLVLLTVMSTWNDFSWPLIALQSNSLYTLPVGLLYLQDQTGSDFGAIMALALLTVLPIVLLFLFFQRYFVQGFARSGIK